MDRLRAMEVFVRVAECGSFARAAESLNLSNATVTTHVSQLERHLGVTLINRDTRRLRLTEEGQTCLKRMRDWLAQLAQAENELRGDGAELRGRLNVEATISVAHSILSDALPEFARRHPQVTVAVSLSNRRHDLIERAIDAAIRVGHVERPHHVSRFIGETRHVLCCAPELAAGLPAHPRDLDPRQCIGLYWAERQQFRPWLLRRGVEELEIRPDGPLHFNSSDNALAAARAGAGVVCALDVLANVHLAHGTLVPVYADWETPVKSVHVETPTAKVGSPRVEAFIRFLYEVIERDRRLVSERLRATGVGQAPHLR